MDVKYLDNSEFAHYLDVNKNEKEQLLANKKLMIIFEPQNVYDHLYYTVKKDFISRLMIFKHEGKNCFDCLRNAEQIMYEIKTGNPLMIGNKVYSCIANESHKRTNINIGDISDDPNDQNKRNRDNVNNYAQRSDYVDSKINPEIGNAFFICECDTENGPIYHAAAVIFKTDKQIITLETWGETQNWWFGIYSNPQFIQDTSNSFHNLFCNGSKKYHTVEIMLKNS